MFDRVVCISLARRSERWEQFQQGLPVDWPFPRPKRVRAVDGNQANPPIAFAPATIPVMAGLHIGGIIPEGVQVARMSGAWGCYRSHLRVIEDALTDGCEAVLVFEDDAVFATDFSERAKCFVEAVPVDWHQIYLGGQHLGTDSNPPEMVNEDVLRCRNVNRTHAYAIRRSMMRDVYRTLSSLPKDPQDAQDLHIDHRLGRMHASGKWNIYAPRQWLVGQRSGQSDTGGRSCGSGVWWNDFHVAETVPC